MSLALLTRGFIFPATIQVAPALVTQPPHEPAGLAPGARQLTTEVPEEVTGVQQSDVLIRAMLVRAIDDLRADPGQLDAVFASLKYDDLTVEEYGEAEIAKAKRWFLDTHIPVKPDYLLTPPEAASLSTSLVESTEDAATLADVHYEPRAATDPAWRPLAGPFAARSYTPSSRVLVLPPEVADSLEVVAGMEVVDAAGRAWVVREVLSEDAVVLNADPTADFRRSFIRTPGARMAVPVESLVFRETYRVGVHVHGDPSILLWAHSIAVWALLRYKQAYLEGRGFERASFSSGPFARDERWDVENMWTRYVNVTGYVRTVWSKDASDLLTAVHPVTAFSPTSREPLGAPVTDGSDDGDGAPWLVD